MSGPSTTTSTCCGSSAPTCRSGRRACGWTAPHGLHGAKVQLPFPSVGATEQVLLTAVRAQGVTELSNAAVEPEIIDLICVLQKMGAIISVETDRVIKIEGVDHLGGYEHTAIPDRIEAGSWACAALATRGDVYVRGAQQQPMMPFLNVFRKVGGAFAIDDEGIRFWHPGGPLRSLVLETDVHPGFMTDWQQPLVVALTQTSGLSIVHETVYENRLGFTEALAEMGAVIQLYRECLGGSPCRFGRAQLPPLRGGLGSDAPARRGDHGPGPAWRLQLPHRGARRRGHVQGPRHRPHLPRLRAVLRQAGRSRSDLRRGLSPLLQPIRWSSPMPTIQSRSTVRPSAARSMLIRWPGRR